MNHIIPTKSAVGKSGESEGEIRGEAVRSPTSGKYVSVRLDSDVYREVLILKASLIRREQRSISISEAIAEMLTLAKLIAASPKILAKKEATGVSADARLPPEDPPDEGNAVPLLLSALRRVTK